MTTLSYLLLAARKPLYSARLYSDLLGVEPVESSDSFVLFVLPTGLKLGLWLKDEMEPPTGTPDGIDLSFAESDREAVGATFDRWEKLGLEIIQPPVDMDFGFTFTARDPDGHRLRVFSLHEDPR